MEIIRVMPPRPRGAWASITVIYKNAAHGPHNT